MDNQCDGCKLGLPVKDGIHYFKNGKIYMGCEKNKYAKNYFKDFKPSSKE